MCLLNNINLGPLTGFAGLFAIKSPEPNTSLPPTINTSTIVVYLPSQVGFISIPIYNTYDFKIYLKLRNPRIED